MAELPLKISSRKAHRPASGSSPAVTRANWPALRPDNIHRPEQLVGDRKLLDEPAKAGRPAVDPAHEGVDQDDFPTPGGRRAGDSRRR